LITIGLVATEVTGANAYLTLTGKTDTPGPYGHARVAVSPDGGTIYTVSDGTVVALRPVADSRGVAVVDVETDIDTLAQARAVAISPDGAHVYVASVPSIVGFRRDPATGALDRLNVLDMPTGLEVATLVFSPDGRHLYGNAFSAGIVAFERDAGSGTLRSLGTMLDDDEGVDYAQSIAISPDGANLYLAFSSSLGGLGVFARDATTGALSLIQTVRDRESGYLELAGFLTSVVVSPDGAHVYATTREGFAVRFNRQPDGRLSAPRRFGTDLGVGGNLAMSPDGRVVYGTSVGAIAVLRREPASGDLELVEHVDALAPPQDSIGIRITPAPDGEDVYMVDAGQLAIVHLHRTCGDGVVDPHEACDDGNRNDGDGCSSACTVEGCFTCRGTPSMCTAADGLACDDENPCTSGESCTAGRCTGGTSVADGTPCSDADACTDGDTCLAGACVPGPARACGPCEICDRDLGCAAGLMGGCRVPPEFNHHGRIHLTRQEPTGATVRWTFVGNDGTRASAFPNPRRTDYTFCVLDGRGPFALGIQRHLVFATSVAAAARCGHHACWKRRPSGGFAFRAPGSTAARRIDLVPAGPKRRSITFDGVGSVAPDAMPLSTSAFGVTVQFFAGDRCWQAGYRDFIQTNEDAEFDSWSGESSAYY
jgi:cysteine-rich repeat protein